MQLIKKPSYKPSGSSRKPILLEPYAVSVLEKLAHDEDVSSAVMVRRMVEQLLVSDTLAASFLEYVHDYWWGYKTTAGRSVSVLRVDSETFSLLLYLSNTSGFAQKTDQIAENIVSFYSQIVKTVPVEPRALAVLATQQQPTSTQPQL
jgi:hypothetical protein